ncbi:unnamed protein product [Boreogadus saida]
MLQKNPVICTESLMWEEAAKEEEEVEEEVVVVVMVVEWEEVEGEEEEEKEVEREGGRERSHSESSASGPDACLSRPREQQGEPDSMLTSVPQRKGLCVAAAAGAGVQIRHAACKVEGCTARILAHCTPRSECLSF